MTLQHLLNVLVQIANKVGIKKNLKEYKLTIVQRVERWIVCTPLSVNVFANTRHTVIFGMPL
jgi:hypothetical protein